MPFYSLSEQFMSTHEDINLTIGKICENLLCMLCRTSTGEIIHTHRKVCHTVAEGLVMLESQNRGRHEYCHLL